MPVLVQSCARTLSESPKLQHGAARSYTTIAEVTPSGGQAVKAPPQEQEELGASQVPRVAVPC